MNERKIKYITIAAIKKKKNSSTESPTKMDEMNENTENSRLVGQNNGSQTRSINVLANLLAVVFVAIIIYCSFAKEFSLFTFHPILMSLGVSFIL